MGNRGGRIHDAAGQIVRHHASKRWIACVLQFKGRQRQVMGDSYTELFFHDEAVALAAGHRPCFECRRVDALSFAAAWREVHGGTGKADAMDAVLHPARLAPPHAANANTLPNGTVIQTDRPHLLWGDLAFPWTWEGYRAPISRPTGKVTVLTPAPVVAVLRAGYRPQVAWPAGFAPDPP